MLYRPSHLSSQKKNRLDSRPLETRRGSGEPHIRAYVWKNPPSSFQAHSKLGLRLSKTRPRTSGVDCAKVNPSHQSILDSSYETKPTSYLVQASDQRLPPNRLATQPSALPALRAGTFCWQFRSCCQGSALRSIRGCGCHSQSFPVNTPALYR